MGNKLIKHSPPSFKKPSWVDDHFRKEIFYLKSIIRKMPGSIYWKDKNGIYLGCNDFVLSMAGTNDLNDVVGKTDFYLPWKEYASEIKRIDDQVMLTNSPLELEEHPTLADGRQVVMLTRKVPLLDENGKVEGVLGISIDITDRKNLEIALIESKEKAEAANQAKTEFLENMRHDIRTPLAGIVGFAKMIEEETHDPIIKDYVNSLTASSYALSDLLNEILETIKLNSGSLPIGKNKFDLNERLKDIIRLNQANAHQKNIELIFEYDTAIPSYILGDSKRVHRIVLELMINAINFTHAGSVKLKTILAKAAEQDLIIKIIVEDTGIGIDPKDHEAVFFQFKRLIPAYKGTYKGTGLGLSIVKQFIEELQGEIYIESQVGSGSKFICILPFKKPLLDDEAGLDKTTFVINKTTFVEDKQTKDVLCRSKKYERSHIHILLVEDYLLAAKAVVAIFEKLGCKVDIAQNSSIALQLAQERKYDVILMDIGLPDVDGYEVTRRIRLAELSKGIHTPIIALSAHTESEHTQHCIKVGMNTMLTKPLTKEKAEDILNIFAPYWQDALANQKQQNHKKNKNCVEPSSLAVIDFEFVKSTTAGNNELVDEMFTLFLQTLPEELTKLQVSYENEDWESVRVITHKLKGGTSYCGTLRLNQICTKLEEATCAGNKEIISLLYQQMIIEIDAVKNAIQSKFGFN